MTTPDNPPGNQHRDRVPLYLKLAYVLLLIWSAIYLWLYF